MVIGLVGISAVGKTFLKRSALDAIKELYPIRQVTLRPKQLMDIDGLDRCFISEHEFRTMQNKGQLFSIQNIYGYKYAFKKKELLDNRKQISEMWYGDVSEIKSVTQVISIYIFSNDSDRIIENLKLRYEDENSVQKRINEDIVLKKIHNKMISDNVFDYIFENKFDIDSELKFAKLVKTITEQNV